jgi:hypothetical protein
MVPLLIPEDKSAAVTRGLCAAFGSADFEDIQPMTRGLSSDLVFRVVVQGSPYLLRVIIRVNEMTDPGRHFGCMMPAAEAGVAPRVLYASVEDGVSITDFVEAVPWTMAEARVGVPPVLRRLHGLAPFPKTFNYVTSHNFFIWKFRGMGLLPSDQVAEVFGQYERVCAVYPRLDADMVSSHSDLKPENILFDGARVWLVDWQAAFVNDRYFDLSVAANFVVWNEAEEREYLAAYFGQAADEYQAARFFLMRQVMHMMAAVVYLMLGAGGKPVDVSVAAPSFREFHERIWAGGVSLADLAQRVEYGRVHWGRLIENVRSARFEEVLRIVMERDAGAARLLPGPPVG